MALSGNYSPARRGFSTGRRFGYPIAPGEVIYTGGLTGVNASGQSQRIQTAGTVAFVGIAEAGSNNAASAAAGSTIVGQLDCYRLPVPGATPANIGAPVYATDDNTLTLTKPTSGFEGVVGYLAGIENGATWVELSNH